MMGRPAVLITVSYVLGLIMGRGLIPAAPAIIVPIIALLLAGAYILYKKTKRGIWFIALPFFAVGVIAINLQKAPGIFDGLDGRRAVVKGIAEDVYLTDYGRQIITVGSCEIIAENSFKTNKKISVRIDNPQRIVCGQYITAYGTAEKLNFKRNPGGYTESLFMRAKGIGGKLTAARIETGKIESLGIYYFRRIADNISETFYDRLPDDMAGLMNAIVLGDRSGVSDEINENFQKTGVAHILSISGLHLSLAAMLVFELLRFLGVRLNGCALASIIMLWAYSAVTGMSVSTVRAALMTSIFMLGYIFKRSPDTFNSVAVAAFAILIVNPLSLWDAGFLLSFSAVIGIGFYTSVVWDILPEIKRSGKGSAKLSGYMAATVAATAFTMPVCAYFFHYVSLSGLVVNMLIVPFASLLVAAGLAFAVFGGIFVSGLLASVLFAILKYFISVTVLFAELPFSYVTTGQPELYNIALYYIILISIGLLAKNTGNRRTAQLLKTAAICAACGLAAVNVYKLFPADKLEIAFLDVGQGDAAVLHLKDADIMIDGGGHIYEKIGENTGYRVVHPYLRYKGKTRLNAVFLTHPDIDHAAGVIEIMGLMKVNRLFVPDVAIENDVLDLVLETAEREGVPVTKIKSGYTAVLGSVRIACVYPLSSDTPIDINNSSLTLRITHGENSFLFTGDIEKEDERKILLSAGDIKSDVLKVPHHGSGTSSTKAFIDAVSPEYALLGTAKNNIYGHPVPAVLEALSGVKLYNTADEGAVLLKSDGNMIEISTMREEAERWTN